MLGIDSLQLLRARREDGDVTRVAGLLSREITSQMAEADRELERVT
jgi:hypothetical protein